jgi:uncharacterized protein (TIGR02687 family)
LSKIAQTLTNLFKAHRLVFWYDADASMREEYEAVELTDVRKLLIDENEFGIKYEVLKKEPNQKFLIYAPFSQPKDEENWLLDLLLSHHIFSADKESLILLELGLDIRAKPLIAKYAQFFKSSKRIQAFKAIIRPDDSSRLFSLKLLAIALHTEADFEEILLKVLSAEKWYAELEKLKLSEDFWWHVRQRFGYESDVAHLDDLLFKLLENHFYFYVDKSKAKLNNEARLFVKNWMDSSRYKDAYIRAEQKVTQTLGIEERVLEYDYKKLLRCDTYEKCEQLLIKEILQSLKEEQFEAGEILKMIESREHTFWYGGYRHIYTALKFAARLISFVKETDFKMPDFTGGIVQYQNRWYQGDAYYRKYIYHANHAEHIELLKPLNSMIDDLYLNSYLRVLNDNWQNFISDYGAPQSVAFQKDFFAKQIVPLLEKKQRVFVIISDALRYECGVELKERLIQSTQNKKAGYDIELNAMVSALPSYTQLGIASLLPHHRISIKANDDTVYIDEKSTRGTQNRNKILQKHHKASVYIDDETFMQFSRDEGRAFCKEHSLIYIYHNEIDATGDKRESEEKVFEAVEHTFVSLTKLVRQIANFNGTNIFITSDHGFVYTNKPTEESEFCKVKADGAKVNRRYIIGKGVEKNRCLQKFTPPKLHLQGDTEIFIARSINKIRKQGGGHRFVHGGGTLQEIVIPSLFVKAKRIDSVKEVDVEVVPLQKITTNTINVTFYQSEPVSEKRVPLTLKAGFYTKDGKLVSEEFTSTFDSSESENRNREKKMHFTFKKEIENHNHETISLILKKVLENSSEEPLYKKIDIKLSLSFFNDFDDDF